MRPVSLVIGCGHRPTDAKLWERVLGFPIDDLADRTGRDAAPLVEKAVGRLAEMDAGDVEDNVALERTRELFWGLLMSCRRYPDAAIELSG